MSDHLDDQQTRSWDDLKQELFSETERNEIDAGAQRLIAEARAYRLSEIRRRQHTTQVKSPRQWE